MVAEAAAVASPGEDNKMLEVAGEVRRRVVEASRAVEEKAGDRAVARLVGSVDEGFVVAGEVRHGT